MRYVQSDRLPKLANLAGLDTAKAELAAIADPEERAAYIRANATRWTALRQALWGLNGCKCWYSEALIQAGQGHVEHYRPKSGVAREAHGGYWWRAFDWTNYRLAHPTANVRITDYLTGTLAGKGTYFPLRAGNTRATNADEEANEEPVLLDPTKPQDCRLLCFDATSGRPIPRYSKDADAWLHQRAQESIAFYHLDEGTWNVQRKDLIDEVNSLCDQIEQLKDTLPASEGDYNAALDDLAKYLGHMAEFSSVAFQTVRERGLWEHLYPLPGE